MREAITRHMVNNCRNQLNLEVEFVKGTQARFDGGKYICKSLNFIFSKFEELAEHVGKSRLKRLSSDYKDESEPHDRICLYCDAGLDGAHGRRKVCDSEECQRKHRTVLAGKWRASDVVRLNAKRTKAAKAKRLADKAKAPKRYCIVCGTDITTHHGRAKVCRSKECLAEKNKRTAIERDKLKCG